MNEIRRLRIATALACLGVVAGSSTALGWVDHAPEVTHISTREPLVFEDFQGQAYESYAAFAAQDMSSQTNAKPSHVGPVYSNYGLWKSHGDLGMTKCYDGTIEYRASIWGTTGTNDFWGRTVPRRLSSPAGNPCNSWHYVDCITAAGTPTGNCDSTDHLAHHVIIRLNKSFTEMQIGQPYVQHTVSHEMGHAFGLSHYGTTSPPLEAGDCWFMDDSMMYGKTCFFRFSRRATVGPLDIPEINAKYP